MKFYGDERFVIYMDSLTAHTSALSSKFIKDNNIDYILAPHYSPELNPAEMFISKVKCWVRRQRMNDLVNEKKRTMRYLIK